MRTENHVGAGTTTVSLGAEEGGDYLVGIEGTGYTGTLDIQGRVAGSTQTLSNIGYRLLTAPATNVAGTQITATAFVIVNTDGMDVIIDVAVAGGSVNIWIEKMP